MMKRILTLVISAALALCGLPCAAEKYPTEWDLTDLYASPMAWNEACAELHASLDALGAARGKAFTALDDAFSEASSRLYTYADLVLSLDPSDADGLAMNAAYNRLMSAYYDATAHLYGNSDGSAYSLVPEQVINAYDQLTYVDIPAVSDALDADNPYGAFLGTYTALLSGHMNGEWETASSYGYDTTLAYELDGDDVPEEAYRLAMAANREHMDLLHRYFALYDQCQLSQEHQETFTFDEAVDGIVLALGALGDDYVSKALSIIEAGHVDAYPSDTKASYSFSTSTYAGDLPYVYLNFEGGTEDVCTFAHEMGHAVYDAYTDESQAYADSITTVYTHEVASLTNELLYYFDRLDRAQGDAETAYILEQALENVFYDMLFSSAAMSEMEDALYKAVESGEALDADGITKMYADMWRTLFGDEYEVDDKDCEDWPAESSIFDYAYYNYMYVTAVNYASIVAQRIHDGEAGAVENYLDFLRKGATQTAQELLAGIGIDVCDAQTYEAAYELMEKLVDEYGKYA